MSSLTFTVLSFAVVCLEEQRARMRMDSQETLLSGTTDAGTDNSDCRCGWASLHSSAYIELLRGQDLWPLPAISSTIAGILTRLETMDDPTMPRGWVQCNNR